MPIADAYTPEKPLASYASMNMGISMISAVLKRNRHQTRLLVLGINTRANEGRVIGKVMEEFHPDIIGFTAVATTYAYAAHVARRIRSTYRKPYLLAGGPHVSLNPEEAIAEVFDSVCIGEGEFPTLELAERIDKGEVPSRIDNLWIRHEATIERNPTRPFIQDLDGLPFADREMWDEWIDFERISEIGDDATQCFVLLGRGCPFRCTYCSNHALRRLAPGRYVRLRSPESIVQEINLVLERHPFLSSIYLEVETLVARKGWALELCNRLAKFNAELGRPISFRCNIRITPDQEFDSLFAAFRKANITAINIGLESGSERIRGGVLRRNYSNEDVIRTVETARNHGIKVSFFNLIGLPGETYDDFLQTVRMNRICRPDSHSTYIYQPYPGTDLYRLCQEKSIIRRRLPVGTERIDTQLDLPGFSRRRIRKSLKLFDYYVYKGLKPLPVIMGLLLKNALRWSPLLILVRQQLRRNRALRKLRRKLFLSTSGAAGPARSGPG